MAIREIITYPDERLKREAEDVLNIDEKVLQVINDLRDTLLATSHSTGVAATQFGELLRIVIVNAGRNNKCTEHNGEMVLINPEIIEHDGLIQNREGCMSVPDFTGNVTRAEKITLKYHNEKFEEKILTARGFEAILIQHETDHLDGILFIDRVISKRTDIFRRKGK